MRALPYNLIIAVLLLGGSLLVIASCHMEQNGRENQTPESRAGQPISRDGEVERALSRLDERLRVYPADHEASLLKGLIYFRRGDVNAALAEIDSLRKRAPSFQLAHMVYADLLMAKLQPVKGIGQADLFGSLSDEAQTVLQGLQQEAEYRLAVQLDRDRQNRIPRQILALGKTVAHAIVVDKSMHRLFLFEQNQNGRPPHLVRDYYVTTGKKRGNKTVRGDLRTPEGVYFVTRWIPDAQLPDKYGVGAFPVNYPNELDRKQGKTGHGIWLHGTEHEFYSRPPLDSEGCVVLSNYDLNELRDEIKPGVTPVIITPRVDWIDESRWRKTRKAVLAELEQWKQDWESLDVERYLSHYDKEFWTPTDTLNSWKQRKRLVAKSKSYQQVTLDDISVFAYPGKEQQPDLVVARLHQIYRSNNFNSEGYKRFYLTQSDGRWRIVYEGK